MSTPGSDVKCERCGSTNGVQAVFLGSDGGSALLCVECLGTFESQRNFLAQTFIGNATVKKGVELILQGINEMYGVDLERDDIKQTPQRVARMYAELCSGYAQDPAEHLKVLYPAKDPGGLIKVGPIDFISMCIHHLALITGRAYVGYVPGQSIVGLSKIARVVLAFAKRLQIQEYMTYDIAECLEKHLQPKGLMVVVHARHDCMCKRGVGSSTAWTTTSEVRGVFFDDERRTKEEFLTFVGVNDGP